MFRRSVLALAISLAALPSTGCPNTDAAVFVDAEIETLGVSLTGSFTLRLHLSARASGPSEVSFGAFSLSTADQSETLVDALPVVASQAAPIEVAPDDTIEVELTIDTGADLLDAALVDRICAGPVVVSGVVDDTLRGGSVTAVSPPIVPSGCP
jgi:hypothetical protein